MVFSSVLCLCNTCMQYSYAWLCNQSHCRILTRIIHHRSVNLINIFPTICFPLQAAKQHDGKGPWLWPSNWKLQDILLWSSGKGKAKGRPRKVTQRSFMDGGWWMVDILSLMLYTKFGCVTFPPPPPPTGSLLISRINLFIGQVR